VVTRSGIGIHRVVDGKLVELLVQLEEMNLGQQLGVIPPPGQTPAALAEVNKAVVRRIYDEAYNRTNPAAAPDLIAADVLGNGRPFGGPQAVLDNVASLVAARPDLHYTIDVLVAEGDLVVVRLTSHGTLPEGFDHPLFGHLAPTGQALDETGINIHRVVDGKVVETWGMKDSVQLGQQLSLLVTRAQAPT
jgi:predicted ester cyclase